MKTKFKRSLRLASVVATGLVRLSALAAVVAMGLITADYAMGESAEHGGLSDEMVALAGDLSATSLSGGRLTLKQVLMLDPGREVVMVQNGKVIPGRTMEKGAAFQINEEGDYCYVNTTSSPKARAIMPQVKASFYAGGGYASHPSYPSYPRVPYSRHQLHEANGIDLPRRVQLGSVFEQVSSDGRTSNVEIQLEGDPTMRSVVCTLKTGRPTVDRVKDALKGVFEVDMPASAAHKKDRA